MKWPGRKLRVAARFVGPALLLPIDCTFCLYDVLVVNLRKTGWFEYDCRGPIAGDGPCHPCLKYTNRWLFRLVCRDVEASADDGPPRCSTGEQVHIHAARSLLGAAMMLVVFVGSLVGVALVWPELNPPQQDKKAVERLLQERIRLAEAAFSQGNYKKALDLYRRALHQEDRPELRCRAGLCLEKLGKRDEAMKQYGRAVEGEMPVPQAAQKLAVAAFRNGRFLEAGRLAKHALEADIDDDRLHAIVAESYQLQGQKERADNHLSKVGDQASDQELFNLARARILSHRDELEKAERLLENVEGRLASSLPASLCRAELHWRRGKRAEAVSEVRKVVETHPNTAGGQVLLVKLLLWAGRTQEALDRVETVREEFSFAPGLKLRVAQVLHQSGHDGVALDLAVEVDAEGPTELAANLLAAQIYLARGLPRRAAHYASQALAESPENVHALLLAGRAARLIGNMEDARKRFERAVELAPKQARTHHLLAKVLMAQGNKKQVLQSFEKACELAPRSGEIRCDYGEALIEAGRQQAGASQLDMAARQMSNPRAAFTRLGMLAQKEGDTEAAMDYYSRAVGSDPGSAVVASNNLATLMLREGKNRAMALALAYLARANASSSSTATHAVDTLTRALIETGNTSSALVPARRAVEAKPGDPVRQLRLGMAEQASGNRAKAEEALNRAVELADKKEVKQRARKLLQAIQNSKSNDT